MFCNDKSGYMKNPNHSATPTEWIEFRGNGLSLAQVRRLTNVDDLLALSVTSLQWQTSIS